ncbi:MAG: asparagine synthase (glutamine-hydrolyzing) [Cyclobacteriaceae bacterium]|nr:asparagine synthase (glutamine-hydrolyzing) [Cyclobacteriaceae bacterium]
MCGITGVLSYGQLREEDLGRLRRATGLLFRRGPDAEGVWSDEKTALGHRRLSVIDPSERGNQPMVDTTGPYVIVYNGEIYNFSFLRNQLEEKGHTFHTTTDTEVVIKAYREWGTSCVEKFNGIFAFAIYNRNDQSLFLARDRFGVKPLLYAFDERGLAFASEMKALIHLTGKRPLDKEGLNLYFQLTYIPAPHTIFEGIKKLLPGHSIYIKEKHHELNCYYRIPYRSQPRETSFEKAKIKLKEALTRSVRDQLVADVPLGTFLSGGIDSSIISLLAAREVNELNTFSIGYRDHPFFDETSYAELVVERYGTRHHTFRLSNQDLLEHVSEVVDYLDEPFADSSALPVFILSRLTRQHVTVALSGDGADELFSGYNKHPAWIAAGQSGPANRMIKQVAPFVKAIPGSRDGWIGNKIRQVGKYAQIVGKGPADRYWHLASFGSFPLRSALLREDFLTRPDGSPWTNGLNTDFNTVLEADMHLILPGDMLHKVDMMSMANALEVRVPFLDHRVVDMAFDMPVSYKIQGDNRKRILREAFKDDLPESLFRRGKHGFEVPLLDWFRKEWKGELDQVVFNRKLVEEQGIFQWEGVAHVREKVFSKNPGDAAIHTWQLYVFQKWWSKYALR